MFASGRKPSWFKAIYLAPVLAIVALMAWAFASPVGAGPDDDYHLVSAWCSVVDGDHCSTGSTPESRVVPEAVVESPCFAQDPLESAACQEALDFTGETTTDTRRGNFVGAYPPVYYAVMSVFVGDDIVGSAMLMRLFNILVFVGLTTALFVLLRPERRQALVWGWAITTVPMGLFLIASNNPSGWAVTGVGTAWIALLGYLESVGPRKWLLGAIFAVGTIMAAGSRADAAIYAVLGIGAVFVLTFPRTREGWKKYALDAILPVALAIVCLFFFLTSRQSQSGTGGFGGGSSVEADVGQASGAEALTGFGQFAYNLLNVPFLWAGNFGEWGLGWLDTSMPAAVTYAAIASFIVVGFLGLARLWGRKLFVVLAAGLTLWLLPVYVLSAGGDIIGESVQPRYVLPLIVLFGGLLVLSKRGRPMAFTRAQAVLVVAALSVANFLALHFNMRRYITGVDEAGLNLDSGIEWWWDISMSPMFVWIIGSAAYAGLLGLLVRHLGRQSPDLSEARQRSDRAIAEH